MSNCFQYCQISSADKIIGLFLVHLQQLRRIAIEVEDWTNKTEKNNTALFLHLLFRP